MLGFAQAGEAENSTLTNVHIRTFGRKVPSRTHDPVAGERNHRAPIAPARSPPAWGPFDQTTVFAPVATVTEPAFVFDQTVTW